MHEVLLRLASLWVASACSCPCICVQEATSFGDVLGSARGSTQPWPSSARVAQPSGRRGRSQAAAEAQRHEDALSSIHAASHHVVAMCLLDGTASRFASRAGGAGVRELHRRRATPPQVDALASNSTRKLFLDKDDTPFGPVFARTNPELPIPPSPPPLLQNKTARRHVMDSDIVCWWVLSREESTETNRICTYVQQRYLGVPLRIGFESRPGGPFEDRVRIPALLLMC